MSFQRIVTGLCNLIFSRLNPSPKSDASASSSGVTDLPTCVVLQIFFKLPVHTIIRCKFVCKSWYNLISDPFFVSTYQTNPPFSSIVGSEHKTITNPLDHESFHIIEIGINGDLILTPFNPNLLNFPTNGILGIMGSCNGLLCLVKTPQLESETSRGSYISNRDSIYNNQTICVVNPLSGECIRLPDTSSAEDIRDVVYGFGENKVIRMVIRYLFPGDERQEIRVFGEIFTLGVDTKWRCFEDPCIPCYIFPCGITLNGCVHWVGDDRHRRVVYALDVAAERGKCFSLPPGLGDEAENVFLAIWNHHICLTDNASNTQVDVWIMRQYGVDVSWSREVILKSRIPRDLRPYPLIPITTLGNGDLLLSRQYSRSLISFDPKSKRCRKFEASHVEGAFSYLYGFTPSFTSLRHLHSRNQSQQPLGQ